MQNTDLGDVHHTMKAEKAKVRRIHSVREKETLVAVEESITSDLKRSRELAGEGCLVVADMQTTEDVWLHAIQGRIS